MKTKQKKVKLPTLINNKLVFGIAGPDGVIVIVQFPADTNKWTICTASNFLRKIKKAVCNTKK